MRIMLHRIALAWCVLTFAGKSFAFSAESAELSLLETVHKAESYINEKYKSGIAWEMARNDLRELATKKASSERERIKAILNKFPDAFPEVKERMEKLKIAARNGNAQAQLNLGECYEKGTGVSKDYAEAVKWYRKAAEQGNAEAQYNLALCYAKGEGVPRNMTEAVKWFKKAGEQGIARAQYNLGVCYFNGCGVPVNKPEAVKWYRKAAEQGHDEAQCILGAHYYIGEDVPQNKTEAVKWFRKAANQGNEKARKILEVITDK